MDKYLCRKDVYDELEKAMRDRSHLVEKVITDKNGHQRKVYVRGDEEPKKQRTKKAEEPAEKKNAKPKHSTGDTVTLDGAKGDFKVSSIDKDGTYHVVSADGKKGYKVSENHITGNKGNAENKKEVTFEKKNQASKSEEVARKNDAENNVNDAIKLTDAEKKEITDTFTPGLLKQLEGKESTTIGNIILNNLYSTGKKDLFNKIREQEWDYKDANDKHGNTFNSDYAKEAMYQLYQEYQKNGKESQKEDYSDWGDMSTEKNETPENWSREDKIKTLVNYQHMMYKDVPMEKWEELYKKDSDEEINKQFTSFSKTHDPEKYINKYNSDNKSNQLEKKETPKKTVSPTVLAYRKQQQKKEKEKYDYNKRMNDFYVNTGLDGGPDAVLYRQAVEKEDNKQDNLKAGVRDDSVFNENDDVQFWRSGNYIDGKIAQVKEDYRGAVSLLVEANGNKYWVETDNIIKHPASAK